VGAHSYQGWERRSSTRQFSWYAGDYRTEGTSSEEFPYAKPTCPTCALPFWDLVLRESRLSNLQTTAAQRGAACKPHIHY